LKLFAPAESLAEWMPPFLGLVEPIDAQTCLLEAGSSSYASMAMQLAMIGVDFEIIEPAELVEEVRRLAERYRKAIGG
jgi:predicted DNA-binding transcriptional regulator YafY